MAESMIVPPLENFEDSESLDPSDPRNANQLEVIELPLESSAFQIFNSFFIFFIILTLR